MKTKRPEVALDLEELEKVRAALRQSEAEVQRLLDEAAARGALVDILHDVMGSLSMGVSQPWSASHPSAASAPYARASAIEARRTSLKLSINQSASRKTSPGTSAMT